MGLRNTRKEEGKMNPLTKEFKNIFPHGKIKDFRHLLKRHEGDVDVALYSYGDIRSWEYNDEKKRIKDILKKNRRY